MSSRFPGVFWGGLEVPSSKGESYVGQTKEALKASKDKVACFVVVAPNSVQVLSKSQNSLLIELNFLAISYVSLNEEDNKTFSLIVKQDVSRHVFTCFIVVLDAPATEVLRLYNEALKNLPKRTISTPSPNGSGDPPSINRSRAPSVTPFRSPTNIKQEMDTLFPIVWTPAMFKVKYVGKHFLNTSAPSIALFRAELVTTQEALKDTASTKAILHVKGSTMELVDRKLNTTLEAWASNCVSYSQVSEKDKKKFFSHHQARTGVHVLLFFCQSQRKGEGYSAFLCHSVPLDFGPKRQI